MCGIFARLCLPLPCFLALLTLPLALLGLPYAAAQELSPPHEPVSPPAILDISAGPQPTQEEIGDALMVHQRYQAAIEAYKNAAPDTPAVWNKMGIAYQMMFDLADARRCYQASLRLDSKNSHVLNNLGTLYDSLGDFRAAEHEYRRALRIDPRSALIEKNLGTNLLAQHRYQQGWEAYQAALAIDPGIFQHEQPLHISNSASVQNRGAVNYYLARSCVRAGLAERAIQYLRNALNEGFTSPRQIAADSEFLSLQEVPAFQQLLAESDRR
jgi:tetratricopeptide (TPR) repeat protein